MITLASPITISPAPVNGKAIKQFTLNRIDWSVSYDSNSATAFIKGANVPLLLWGPNTTPTYAQAGQFTDVDVQNRVIELLGSSPADIEKNILALYPKPFSSNVENKPSTTA